MSDEEQIVLPDGFKRVEYLESTGSQWLNLPITTKVGDKIVLETESKFFDTSNQAEGKNGNPYFFYGINGGKWYCGAGGYSTSSITADTEWHKFRLIHSQNDTGLYIDDIKVQSQTYNSTSIVLNGTINAYRTYNANYYHKTRKKSWKLYINDEIVYNLIPCIDNYNILCMYDLVSQQPFYNQGSGAFLTNKSYEWNYPLLNKSYNLPAGFKKCVYLQSDGTQWIDTGVVPNNETGLFCKTIKLDNSNTSMFGVRDNDSSAIMTPYVGGKSISYRWKAEGKDNIYTLDKAGDYIFSSFLNFYNDRLAKIDSEDTDWATSLSGILENYTQSIWLFSTNFKGSFGTNGKYAGRIYRAQITQGDTLIHDYVPCLDANGRPCMYDIIGVGNVEDNAYYNQSGGTEFSYCVEHQLPSDFIKLKYLESNSNLQHIKTDYIPTNNTGMYVDGYNIVVEDRVVMGMQNTTGDDRMWIGGVMKATYGARYGWGTITTPGGTGDVRFEASLNWLNDKKSIITCPAFAQKVNTLSNLTFTPNQDIYIFGWNRQGSLYHWKGRIYRAKISEGSEIVRDFVPAYDDFKQRPCMYDLINNVAYYNDGEGEFLYNTDFDGNYEGFGTFATIGNKLGSYINEDTEE